MASGLRHGAPPDDPFGPGSQDPDAIREAACRLTAPDRVCAPTETTPPRPTGGGGGGGGALGAVVELLLWVAFIGLVALLVWLLVRALLLRAPSTRRRARREVTADVADEVVELGRTIVDHRRAPADWRAEADEHRRAGRYREALRCRYRALVGDLARRSVIDEIPGRTTGEERRQLAEVAPASSASFAAAADLFDGAWYGHDEVADDDVARMIALEAHVLQHGPHA